MMKSYIGKKWLTFGSIIFKKTVMTDFLYNQISPKENKRNKHFSQFLDQLLNVK